jgi:hypothetical protein
MTKLKIFVLPSKLASPCPATIHYLLGIPHREKKCYDGKWYVGGGDRRELGRQQKARAYYDKFPVDEMRVQNVHR